MQFRAPSLLGPSPPSLSSLRPTFPLPFGSGGSLGRATLHCSASALPGATSSPFIPLPAPPSPSPAHRRSVPLGATAELPTQGLAAEGAGRAESCVRSRGTGAQRKPHAMLRPLLFGRVGAAASPTGLPATRGCRLLLSVRVRVPCRLRTGTGGTGLWPCPGWAGRVGPPAGTGLRVGRSSPGGGGGCPTRNVLGARAVHAPWPKPQRLHSGCFTPIGSEAEGGDGTGDGWGPAEPQPPGLGWGLCPVLSPHPPFPLTWGRPSRRRLGIRGGGRGAGRGAQPAHRPLVLSTHSVPGVARSPCPACGVGSGPARAGRGLVRGRAQGPVSGRLGAGGPEQPLTHPSCPLSTFIALPPRGLTGHPRAAAP